MQAKFQHNIVLFLPFFNLFLVPASNQKTYHSFPRLNMLTSSTLEATYTLALFLELNILPFAKKKKMFSKLNKLLFISFSSETKDKLMEIEKTDTLPCMK